MSLKLDKNRGTIIYINGTEFIQCKRLLISIPKKNVREFDDIASIDELVDKLDEIYTSSDIELSPEIEFWGHCSNLQTWAENNYDTRLLSSDLSFPLLKKLVEAGDTIAKRAFKEEIVKRISSMYPNVVFYLLEERYIKYLSKNEILSILNGIEFQNIELNKNNFRLVLDLLKELSELNSIQAKEQLRSEILRIFKSEDIDLILYIL